VGPVIEEVLKIALATWIVEKRPYLFKSAGQIIVAAVCSGLVFAAIENLIYLHVYVPNPPLGLIAWRWTVCVGLHVGCSTVAANGLVRVWRNCVENFEKPQLSRAASYITAAVVIHGTYNSLAVVASFSNYRF
jgi:RsiW-degrading membrane proteinase PrsW (M82 family)